MPGDMSLTPENYTIFFTCRLQRLHIRLWPDWGWEILYDDGETGRRPGGNHSTNLQRSFQQNQFELK